MSSVKERIALLNKGKTPPTDRLDSTKTVSKDSTQEINISVTDSGSTPVLIENHEANVFKEIEQPHQQPPVVASSETPTPVSAPIVEESHIVLNLNDNLIADIRSDLVHLKSSSDGIDSLVAQINRVVEEIGGDAFQQPKDEDSSASCSPVLSSSTAVARLHINTVFDAMETVLITKLNERRLVVLDEVNAFVNAKLDMLQRQRDELEEVKSDVHISIRKCEDYFRMSIADSESACKAGELHTDLLKVIEKGHDAYANDSCSDGATVTPVCDAAIDLSLGMINTEDCDSLLGDRMSKVVSDMSQQLVPTGVTDYIDSFGLVSTPLFHVSPASLYRQGLACDRIATSHAQAVKLYRQSAIAGYAPAQNKLAVCCFTGDGVEKNISEAVHWYELSAKQGNAAAQNNLGLCYDVGHSVVCNKQEAVRWYKLAADQGYSNGQCNLGLLYYNGADGVQEDPEAAVRLFHQSALSGNAEAAYFLGHCFESGYAVPVDLVEALKWFSLSAKRGHVEAKQQLDLFMAEKLTS